MFAMFNAHKLELIQRLSRIFDKKKDFSAGKLH